MVRDAGPTTKDGAITHHRASGNPRIGGQQAVTAYDHIVGDLNQIIDLRILPNHGVLKGAAVYAGIGPNRDAVLQNNTAQLRNIDNAAGPWRSPKTRFANDRATVDPNAVADQRETDDSPGSDGTVSAYGDARTNHRAGAYPRPCPDLCARANDRAGRNDHPVFQARGRINRRRAGFDLPWPMKMISDLSQGGLRLSRNQRHATSGHMIGQSGWNQTYPSLCRRELSEVVSTGAVGKALAAGASEGINANYGWVSLNPRRDVATRQGRHRSEV
jgi:hypothetical protein